MITQPKHLSTRTGFLPLLVWHMADEKKAKPTEQKFLDRGNLVRLVVWHRMTLRLSAWVSWFVLVGCFSTGNRGVTKITFVPIPLNTLLLS